jgi:carboxyl-terminal processing protease
MLRTTKTLLTVVFFLIICIGCSKRSEGLKQSDIEPLINFVLSNHVSQNTFDDEISARTLDNLVTSLDPWKIYFTKTDFDTIMKDKTKIDDYVKSDDYAFLYKIFEIYRTRFAERIALFNQLIKLNNDYTVNESIESDPKTIPYIDDEKEIRERWRKRIKFQLLYYINSGKSQEDAKKKLSKQYDLIVKDNKGLKNEKIYEFFIEAFSRALDPHTDYMSADEYDDFRIQMNLELEGIGAVLRSDDGYVFVESIIPGGPVSRLPETIKLLPNDKIVAVAQGNNEPEDVIDIPLSTAVKKIRGKKGTTVKLTIIRETEKGKPVQMIIPIVRDKVVLENQTAKSDIYEFSKDTRKHKIGYIKLPMFYMNDSVFQKDETAHTASRDMLIEIRKMTAKGVEALVVDLRGNPGGSLSEAITTTGLFIKDGPVVLEKSHDKIQTDSDYDAKMYYDGPIIVLIDKLSASASEIFAGALKDYRRAIILGSASFGKGSVQNLMPVQSLLQTRENSGAIKVTVQLFYQPSGKSNHLNGVQPDIAIADLTDILDIGESKLKYPLKWTPIKTAYYESFGDKYVSNAIIANLSEKSAERRKSDKDFIALGEKIEKYRKKISSATVSLKKDAGDNVVDEVEKQQKEKEKREKSDQIMDLKKDNLLRETFNIMADYIELLKPKGK